MLQVSRTDLVIDLSPLLDSVGPQYKDHLAGPLPQMLLFNVLLDLADRRSEDFAESEVFDHLYGFVTRNLEMEWPQILIGDDEDYARTIHQTYWLIRNAIFETIDKAEMFPASLLFVLPSSVGVRLDYVKKA